MTQPDNPATIKPQATSHKPSSVLVSVIIPAYNTARYIYRAIESSLRQTHSNIEILIINDGSIDDTLEVARSYEEKDSRIRVFTQENAGVSVARNVGIREAKGEYLVFLDSDDWMEDNALEVMLDTQAKYPDRLVAANSWNVYLDDDREDIMLRARYHNVPSRTLTLEETVHAQCDFAFPRTAHAKIFSASLIREHSLIFFEGIHYGEDQLFGLEYLFLTSGSAYIETPLFNILHRENSATQVRFSEWRKDKEDWHSVILSKPGLPPEIYLAFRIYTGKDRLKSITYAGMDNVDEILRTCQERAKPFLRDVLSCKRYGNMKKLYEICQVYLPVPLARLAMSLRKMLKRIKATSTKKEIIPYW